MLAKFKGNTYSLKLNENKKIKPSPPVENHNRSRQLGAQQLYDNSISSKSKNVNRKITGTELYSVAKGVTRKCREMKQCCFIMQLFCLSFAFVLHFFAGGSKIKTYGILGWY